MPPAARDPGQVRGAGPARPVAGVIGDLGRVADGPAGQQPVPAAAFLAGPDRDPRPVVLARAVRPGPGQRRRKKVSGKTKTEVRAKLAELHDELTDGVVTNAAYTVAHGIRDLLADGLAGRAPKKVSTQREVLEPLIGIIGAVSLRELSAATVEANDKVRRNVATLVDTPAGQEGRPSKSLTFGQAVALVQAARSYGLYDNVVLSLLVRVRTKRPVPVALRTEIADGRGGYGPAGSASGHW
jgi:hypothetical protein